VAKSTTETKPSLLGCAILQRLARSPMSGYELKKLFTTPVGYGWRAYDTQIYRELKALEQMGLVQGQVQPGRAGPQRRVYQPTLQGRRALREWLNSPLDETAVKSELTMRVWSVDLFPPDALRKLVATVREQTQAQMQHMMGRREELRDRFGPPETSSDPTVVGRLLVLEYEIEAAQFKLRWLERIEAVHTVRALLNDSESPARRSALLADSRAPERRRAGEKP
jgi:PadR family transcriptional regulator, regulatory protein AphA